MSLPARIVRELLARGAKCAVIGGEALAVHGIARATLDLDLLTTDAGALDPSFASAVGGASEVRRGERDDPLVGLVRFTDDNEVVDLVIGGAPWMGEIVERATQRDVSSDRLPVVGAADLVLLKLYAGGPQDLLDVRLLVAAAPEIKADVIARLGALPREARDAWAEIAG